MVSVVLFDVGGTLWPDRWPEDASDQAERVAALRLSEPALSDEQTREIVGQLARWHHPPTQRQQTLSVVEAVVARVAPAAQVNPHNVTRAMCLPATGRVEPFDGARELLEMLVEQRIRVVLATNVMWRGAAEQHRDLNDLGLAGYVSACVTSLDVGWRKPHRRFFDALLDTAGRPPTECAMVGDSELNDIVPARDLGLLTVKVATGPNRASSSAATHVCASLHDVGEVILGQPNTDP